MGCVDVIPNTHSQCGSLITRVCGRDGVCGGRLCVYVLHTVGGGVSVYECVAFPNQHQTCQVCDVSKNLNKM
jgi:hypothetical protein